METKLKHMGNKKVKITNSEGEEVKVKKQPAYVLPKAKPQKQKPKMKLWKKILIWSLAGVTVVGAILGIYFGCFWQNTEAYGIKHKVLERNIATCVSNSSERQIELIVNFKISMMNPNKYEYNYNLDVLYLELSDPDDTFFRFEGYEKRMCLGDLSSNNLVVIPANQGVNSISGSFKLIRKVNYSDYLTLSNKEVELKLIYNDIEVAEFYLDVSNTKYEKI